MTPWVYIRATKKANPETRNNLQAGALPEPPDHCRDQHDGNCGGNEPGTFRRSSKSHPLNPK